MGRSFLRYRLLRLLRICTGSAEELSDRLSRAGEASPISTVDFLVIQGFTYWVCPIIDLLSDIFLMLHPYSQRDFLLNSKPSQSPNTVPFSSPSFKAREKNSSSLHSSTFFSERGSMTDVSSKYDTKAPFTPLTPPHSPTYTSNSHTTTTTIGNTEVPESTSSNIALTTFSVILPVSTPASRRLTM